MENLENLIINYLEGNLDEVSRRILLNEIKENENTKKLFLELKFIWDSTGNSLNFRINDTDNEFGKFSKKVLLSNVKVYKSNNNIIILRFLKYAAIFIIGFSIAFLLFNNYFIFKSKQIAKYNELIVPKGQRSELVLADGTKIWINSDSKLSYPEKFTNNERKVFLEGEAYFEVAKFKKQKFIVSAGKLEIMVMGTTFNVKNYPEDKKIETILIDGKVSLKKVFARNSIGRDYILKPNQKATFTESDNLLIISDVHKKPIDNKNINLVSVDKKKSIVPEPIIPWKDEVLSIDNESLQDIKTKLERWYGYDIIVNDSTLLQQKYKGRFGHHETIFQVLDAIRLTTPIKYNLTDKLIIIDKR